MKVVTFYILAEWVLGDVFEGLIFIATYRPNSMSG